MLTTIIIGEYPNSLENSFDLRTLFCYYHASWNLITIIYFLVENISSHKEALVYNKVFYYLFNVSNTKRSSSGIIDNFVVEVIITSKNRT